MKCVFFDRDGIVNREPQGTRYIESPDDFVLNDGFVDALRDVLAKGYLAIVVTNQKCVASGVITEAELAGIHSRLRDLLKNGHGLELTDIVYCPHGDDECECRKPKPGMLTRSAEKFGIDLSASWMIGDQPRDIEAGRRAGCRTIYVGQARDVPADHSVSAISELYSLVARTL